MLYIEKSIHVNPFKVWNKDSPPFQKDFPVHRFRKTQNRIKEFEKTRNPPDSKK